MGEEEEGEILDRINGMRRKIYRIRKRKEVCPRMSTKEEKPTN
jgi:hypothetical protein